MVGRKNTGIMSQLSIRCYNFTMKKYYPASIYPLYQAFGERKIKSFTVPAFNLRTLTFDQAKLIFQLAKKYQAAAFIFEISPGEITYTNQSPEEYAKAILTAAHDESYQGPVFIQGDHYQFSFKNYQTNQKKEIERLKTLIKRSIAAGFYNIDIDASTLVELEKSTLDEQQRNNYQMTAFLTKYIRSIQPKEVTISIGGEIGHIGGKNSTPEEFEAFMQGYQKTVGKITGISKVSVQTGTSHGGIPLADGTIAKAKIDFNILKKISDIAQNKYQIGGAVQHGASTLPNKLFDQFLKNNTLEIHLATGFQNIVYDHMPSLLKQEIYQWLKENCKDEFKEGQTEDQFFYKTRKKALGPFKEKIWKLTSEEKKPILKKLEKLFAFYFEKFNIKNTLEIVKSLC